MIDVLILFWPVFVILLMIIAGLILVRTIVPKDRYPYSKKPRLVTKAEFRFYRALQRAVGGSYTIFAMVRIADLLEVDSGTKNYRSWFNKIVGKHIDFVLCDERTLEPVLAIELDDSSHQRADRIERDNFVDHAMESAGLPILRIPVTRSYDSGEIRDQIDELI